MIGDSKFSGGVILVQGFQVFVALGCSGGVVPVQRKKKNQTQDFNFFHLEFERGC
jgi:hypothetical protein